MTTSMYNLAQILAQTQFGQDLYATFQATDDLGRSRRARSSAREVRLTGDSVEQIKQPKAADDIRIDEDASSRYGNFTEMFDKVKKRFEEQRRTRDSHPQGNPRTPGRTIDFIA